MKNKSLKGVLLISLNSKKLDQFIQTGLNKLNGINAQQIDVYIFDTFEILNGVIFNKGDIKTEAERLEVITQSVYKQLYKALPNKGKILKYSDSKSTIRKYMSAVYSEYLTNPSFERHLQSQIFQNLQPKLRRYEITNSKSSLLEIMTPFLLTEFAFYLYVFNEGYYQTIYGLEEEMEFIKSIKEGKYSSLIGFIKNDVEYNKIEF